MVKDKNGKKVTVASLNNLGDFPEIEVPEGMSAAEFEEQHIHALFDTEDEYLDYLWQQEHGVPVWVPIDEIDGYIRSRRLQEGKAVNELIEELSTNQLSEGD